MIKNNDEIFGTLAALLALFKINKWEEKKMRNGCINYVLHML